MAWYGRDVIMIILSRRPILTLNLLHSGKLSGPGAQCSIRDAAKSAENRTLCTADPLIKRYPECPWLVPEVSQHTLSYPELSSAWNPSKRQ